MTSPVGEGFPKSARIRRRREFVALGRSGKRSTTPNLVVLAQARTASCRLGITVSKKVGGAVVRNRLKRHIREAFRRHPTRMLMHRDLIVIAKMGAAALRGKDVHREFAAAVEPYLPAVESPRG
jgi:ribonuclease P protein component